jgi:hypothetical protein
MAVIEPGKGRAIIERGGAVLRITIPAELKLLRLLFVVYWLFVWVSSSGVGVSGVDFGARVRLGSMGGIHPFALILITAWLFAVGWGLYALLWILVGKEIIELSSTTLKYRLQMAFFSYGRKYAVADVTNLRLTPLSLLDLCNPRFPSLSHWGRCAISLDCGRSTRRLSIALDEADAKYVIGEMCKQVKSLCSKGVSVGNANVHSLPLL